MPEQILLERGYVGCCYAVNCQNLSAPLQLVLSQACQCFNDHDEPDASMATGHYKPLDWAAVLHPHVIIITSTITRHCHNLDSTRAVNTLHCTATADHLALPGLIRAGSCCWKAEAHSLPTEVYWADNTKPLCHQCSPPASTAADTACWCDCC